MASVNPNSLFAHLNSNSLPPVESWDPPFCGDINIIIHKNGQWSYNNSVISRLNLVKLFSKVLKYEDNEYFLVTPVEKVRIQVEAEAFITKNIEVSEDKTCFAFMTTLDEVVVAGPEHTLFVEEDGHGNPYPTIHIRNNLNALISRSDFYHLIDLATVESYENKQGQVQSRCFIESNQSKFTLGSF